MFASPLWRIIIALSLTVFLGPGAGHLYLREFKQALLLIAAALMSAVAYAWQVAKAAPAAVTPENLPEMLRTFALDHPGTVYFFDVIFAALWAYALVDAYFRSRGEKLPEEENA